MIQEQTYGYENNEVVLIEDIFFNRDKKKQRK